MDIKKLNPWNWFKHEEKHEANKQTIPVKKGDYLQSQAPLPNIMQLHREIDRLVDEAFRGFPTFGLSSFSNQLSNEDLLPAFHANVDIASDDKQYTISLEAPGMEQKDLSIELKDQALFIKGNKQQEQEEKDKHFYRIERHYGSFERVLAIPDDAETNKITASMKNGVLTIDIPRKEMPATEAKRITIES